MLKFVPKGKRKKKIQIAELYQGKEIALSHYGIIDSNIITSSTTEHNKTMAKDNRIQK